MRKKPGQRIKRGMVLAEEIVHLKKLVNTLHQAVNGMSKTMLAMCDILAGKGYISQQELHEHGVPIELDTPGRKGVLVMPPPGAIIPRS